MSNSLNGSSYESLIQDLFERHPTVQKYGFNSQSFKPGLDSMLDLDKRMGHKWQQYKTIHVAGTNGKGSVSSMLASSLAATGLKVGLYTSPHLTDFRERAKIIENGSYTMIGKEYIMDFLSNYNTDSLSFFEITTAMAFGWFAQEKVDIAVIEAGLGGRLDSTNIINPELSIITSIGLDHCAILGNDRKSIAKEKAGIIKSSVKALIASWDEETSRIFEQTASENRAPLFFADQMGIVCDTQGLDLKGDYQKENLRTVLAAHKLLNIEPNLNAIKNAAKITGLRGRWEILSDKPLIICDIGHNPSALEYNFGQLIRSRRKLHIVYGAMADKDVSSIRSLMISDAHYYLVSPQTPRALAIKDLASIMEGLEYQSFETVQKGAQAAIEAASKDPENSLVYIGGSNFVVSEYLSDKL